MAIMKCTNQVVPICQINIINSILEIFLIAVLLSKRQRSIILNLMDVIIVPMNVIQADSIWGLTINGAVDAYLTRL